MNKESSELQLEQGVQTHYDLNKESGELQLEQGVQTHYDLNKEFGELQLEQGVQKHYDLNKEFVLQSQPVCRPWPLHSRESVFHQKVGIVNLTYSPSQRTP